MYLLRPFDQTISIQYFPRDPSKPFNAKVEEERGKKRFGGGVDAAWHEISTPRLLLSSQDGLDVC
jgi:hypothetical protein